MVKKTTREWEENGEEERGGKKRKRDMRKKRERGEKEDRQAREREGLIGGKEKDYEEWSRRKSGKRRE
jgi:hypothetical protein